MMNLFYFILISFFSITTIHSKSYLFIPPEPKASGRFNFTPSVGTHLKLNNVLFRLTESIMLKIPYVEGRLISKATHHYINFDDPKSFKIEILKGEAIVPVSSLMEILNDIFNSPQSNLRDLNMSFVNTVVKEGSPEIKKQIHLTGRMKFLFKWINFQMIGELDLDRKHNQLVLKANKIVALGVSAKGLMSAFGITLEKLAKVPKGKGVIIKDNNIIIRPFDILPSLDLVGYVNNFALRGENEIYLEFYNKTPSIVFPPLPDQRAKNYLFICNGDVKFGKLMMRHSIMQMIDADPSDWFDFYLVKYFNSLVRGVSYINMDGSVRAVLPDYGDLKR